MTSTELASRVVAMQDTLFRVSFSLLPNRYDQEDAVQESLRIALQKIGSLREPRYFNTWLIRILINECHNIQRKRKREVPCEEIAAHLPPDGDAEVMAALLRLDDKLRLPLVLYYVEGYSVREIASMLGAPESTIKTRMARGKQLARGLLRDEEEERGRLYEQAF